MKFKLTPKKIAVLIVAIVSMLGTIQFPSSAPLATLEDLPAYAGEPYVILDENTPTFTQEEWVTTSFEDYSDLDYLGRCGVAYACIGTDLMPTEDRESISSVTPTGWEQTAYDDVDGGYLYNRAHIIGFQLAGENANELNLITGTRAFNVDGMLPFENEVAEYVKETGNHVLYRVTPYFDGRNLVANGVQMEAYSVEDQGAGVQFNVYCYNAQPGIVIDYSTGESCYGDGDYASATGSTQNAGASSLGDIVDWVLSLFDQVTYSFA